MNEKGAGGPAGHRKALGRGGIHREALFRLRLAEIDRPDIASNEVLVKVRAAGMDRGTWHSMSGKPYLMRVMGFKKKEDKGKKSRLTA